MDDTEFGSPYVPYGRHAQRSWLLPGACAAMLLAVSTMQLALMRGQESTAAAVAELRDTLQGVAQLQSSMQAVQLAQGSKQALLHDTVRSMQSAHEMYAAHIATVEAAALRGRSTVTEPTAAVTEPAAEAAAAPVHSAPHPSVSANELLPYKFLLEGITPSADQMNRGDCWLFATAGIIEDSYRRYGVKKGWFPPNKYLRLSRQALGIAAMELCAKHPNSFCPALPGPNNTISWGKTTEGLDGANEHLFRYMKQMGDIGALPDSVCPYSPEAGPGVERQCDGLEKARKDNPLRFSVQRMRGHYERGAIKRALVEEKKPLSLATSMVWAPFYLPCDGNGCDPSTAECVACPLERVYSGIECCVLANRPMVSMKGEWIIQPGEPLVAEGGHAVNIVGYSDSYRDEFGNVGGYIIRNTWADGLGTAHGLKARGSHTAQFFMQNVNDFDEGRACPNPHSPRMWYPCEELELCKSKIYAIEAASFGKVNELECIDLGFSLPNGACRTDRSYYLKNMTEFGSRGLFVTCFVYDGGANHTGTLCYPPLTIDDLATVFAPKNVDKLPQNNKALCGYNFLPYAVHETLATRFAGVVSTTFDIEWTESSYVSHKQDGLDYSLIEQSTFELAKNPIYSPQQL